jgi:uncharacterized damage-inducible protein DinB
MGKQISVRAAELADSLKQANEELLSLLAGINSEQWQRPVPGDGRSVGVIAHHVAVSHPFIMDIAKSVAAGGGITLTLELVHEANAQHAKDQAGCGLEATLALLRDADAETVAAVAHFDDQTLSRSTANPLLDGELTSASEVIRLYMADHARFHLGAIRTALT